MLLIEGGYTTRKQSSREVEEISTVYIQEVKQPRSTGVDTFNDPTSLSSTNHRREIMSQGHSISLQILRGAIVQDRDRIDVGNSGELDHIPVVAAERCRGHSV